MASIAGLPKCVTAYTYSILKYRKKNVSSQHLCAHNIGLNPCASYLIFSSQENIDSEILCSMTNLITKLRTPMVQKHLTSFNTMQKLATALNCIN